MSSITGLISGGGGGGTPINGIAKFERGGEITFTDSENQEWLKGGSLITSNFSNYPDAIVQSGSLALVSNPNKSLSLVLDTDCYDMKFNNNGTKMYFVGNANDRIYQWSLSTAYDITTATYDNVFLSIGANEAIAYGMEWNDNGLVLYVTGNTNDAIQQYNLGTPFAVNTATHVASFSFGGQDNFPQKIRWNNDGTKLFMLAGSNRKVFEYVASVPYSVGHLSYSGKNFDVNAEITSGNPGPFSFNTDGSKMFVGDASYDNIYQYNLTTNFDITTAKYSGIYFNLSLIDSNPEGMTFDSNMNNMYIIGNQYDKIYQFGLDSFIGIARPSDDYDYLRIK